MNENVPLIFLYLFSSSNYPVETLKFSHPVYNKLKFEIPQKNYG